MRTSDFQQIVGVICSSNDAKIAVFDKIIVELSRQEFIKNDTVMQIFSSCFQPIFEYEAANVRSYCDIDVAKRLGIPEKTVVKLKDEYFVQQFKYKANWWKKAFLDWAENADFIDGKVQFCVPERLLYCTLIKELTKMGVAIKTNTANNVIKLSPCNFIKLKMRALDSKEQRRVTREITNRLKANKNINRRFSRELEGYRWLEIIGNISRNVVVNILTEFFVRMWRR